MCTITVVMCMPLSCLGYVLVKSLDDFEVRGAIRGKRRGEERGGEGGGSEEREVGRK